MYGGDKYSEIKDILGAGRKGGMTSLNKLNKAVSYHALSYYYYKEGYDLALASQK